MIRSSSRAAIAPFLAMEVAREAGRRQEAGLSVIRLDVGQPHLGAPAKACAAATAAIANEPLGYTDGLGAGALRRRIAAWYGQMHGLEISPERVIITTGASGGFALAFLALFNSGDRVAMAAPGYPPYRHILTALGFSAAVMDAQEADGLQLTPAHLDALAAQAPIAGALIASPANPTGAMLDRTSLATLSAKTRALGVPLISDEIYHGLTYGRPAITALAVDDDAVVVNSFSKYWAMTGWRVGWLVVPEALVKPIERLAQNLTIAPPTISQAAALGAMEAEEECQQRLSIYAENRRLLLSELPGLKLRAVAPPDGAFYVLADISAHSDDSLAWCARALEEAGVALTPGVDFCESRGRHWARIAYARSTAEVADGLERLARWLER
jgi:aspartate/methionine/tyrosine aminotransferase